MKPSFLNDTVFLQINRRLESIRAVKEKITVRDGWIKYMRTALGLTLNELDALASLSLGSVAQAERREVDGRVSLSTLKKMADAMNCDLVYAFVPRTDLKTMIHDQAYKKASQALGQADLHMKLENQKVDDDEKERHARIERLAKKFIDQGDIW